MSNDLLIGKCPIMPKGNPVFTLHYFVSVDFIQLSHDYPAFFVTFVRTLMEIDGKTMASHIAYLFVPCRF